MIGLPRHALAMVPVLALACVLGGCSAPAGRETQASPAQSAGSGPTLDPTAEPTGTPDPAAVPPTASIAVDGGDPVVAQLGTYTWGGMGSDSPWLPGTPIGVGGGETLHVTFDRTIDVADWAARYVPSLATGPDGALPLGPGDELGAFTTPPTGSWTVEVRVSFADGAGEASYFWQVTVT
jgi:hypothetical protein